MKTLGISKISNVGNQTVASGEKPGARARLAFSKFAFLCALAGAGCSGGNNFSADNASPTGTTDAVSLSGDVSSTSRGPDSVLKPSDSAAKGEANADASSSCDMAKSTKYSLMIKKDGKEEQDEITDGKVTIGNDSWEVTTDSNGNVTSLQSNGKNYDIATNTLTVTDANGKKTVYLDQDASAILGFTVEKTVSEEVVSNVSPYALVALGMPQGPVSVDLVSSDGTMTTDDGRVSVQMGDVNESSVSFTVILNNVQANGSSVSGVVITSVPIGSTITLDGGYVLSVSTVGMNKPENCATETATFVVNYEGKVVQNQSMKVGDVFDLVKDNSGKVTSYLKVVAITKDMVKLSLVDGDKVIPVLLSNNGKGNGVGVKEEDDFTVNGQPLQVVLTGTSEVPVSSSADAQ